MIQKAPKQSFLILLLSLLTTLALFPFINQFVVSKMIFKLSLSTIFIVSIYLVCKSKTKFIIEVSLLVPTLTFTWLSFFMPKPGLEILAGIFSSTLIIFIIAVISRVIFYSSKISLETVYGATVVYLLLGFAWANLFYLIDIVQPDSFVGIMSTAEFPSRYEAIVDQQENFLYYSFVTLTTLGYGDISPAAPSAKFLSVLESISGQLYIATTIARSVGLYITRLTKR